MRRTLEPCRRLSGGSPVSALLWWLIPLVATLLALAWAASRNRPRRSVGTHESLGDMARFRAAMRKPMPVEQPATPRDRPPARRPASSRPRRSASPSRSASDRRRNHA